MIPRKDVWVKTDRWRENLRQRSFKTCVRKMSVLLELVDRVGGSVHKSNTVFFQLL